jgi:nuclear pore complex protein Nup160
MHKEYFVEKKPQKVSLFSVCQLQGSVTEYEFSQDEFRTLQQEFWCKFYACVLQYQEALSHPLALHLNPVTNMVCLLKKVRELEHSELLCKVQ